MFYNQYHGPGQGAVCTSWLFMSTTWAWFCHVPIRDPCHVALYMKPPYFSSGNDGEFIHMDDSSAVLLGLRVKE